MRRLGIVVVSLFALAFLAGCSGDVKPPEGVKNIKSTTIKGGKSGAKGTADNPGPAAAE